MHIQEKRFQHPDFKLIEISASDLIELGFEQIQRRNISFFRKKNHKGIVFVLKQKSPHCFHLIINNEKQNKIIIKRWYQLIDVWKEKTQNSIFE